MDGRLLAMLIVNAANSSKKLLFSLSAFKEVAQLTTRHNIVCFITSEVIDSINAVVFKWRRLAPATNRSAWRHTTVVAVAIEESVGLLEGKLKRQESSSSITGISTKYLTEGTVSARGLSLGVRV